MFDFEKTIFFPEECFNFVVSSKTFKINSILNTSTLYVFDYNLGAIIT